MKVGIIGTGNIGSALARSLVAAGHQVTLAGRDQEKLAAVAAASGATAGSVADAATGADVTVLAVYWPSASELATQVAELITSIGLRPVKVGGLVRARELEAMAWLNITLNMSTGGDWRSAFRLVGAPAAAVSTPELLAA